MKWYCLDTEQEYEITSKAKFCPGCGKLLPATIQAKLFVQCEIQDKGLKRRAH